MATRHACTCSCRAARRHSDGRNCLQGRMGQRTHGRRTVSELAVHRAKWKCTWTMNGGVTAMIGISTEKKIDSYTSRQHSGPQSREAPRRDKDHGLRLARKYANRT